jgi:GNAT superfamily N-acetyltransferase
VSSADRPAALSSLLTDHGLARAETETAMVAHLGQLEPLPLRGFQVRRARTPEQICEFATINAANWAPPDEDVLRFYEAATPLLLSEAAPLRCYVGYAEGVAVAAAEVTIAAAVAGVYNVSTLEAWRGRGFASALLRHALLDARAEGTSRAVLQAAAGATGLYRRLGFIPAGEITEFKPSAA